MLQLISYIFKTATENFWISTDAFILSVHHSDIKYLLQPFAVLCLRQKNTD